MSERERKEPAGDILGIRVGRLNKDLPRDGRATSGRWSTVYAQLEALPIISRGAPLGQDHCLVVTLVNTSEANRMNSSMHGYSRARNCIANGWRVRQRNHKPGGDGRVEAVLWKEAAPIGK